MPPSLGPSTESSSGHDRASFFLWTFLACTTLWTSMIVVSPSLLFHLLSYITPCRFSSCVRRVPSQCASRPRDGPREHARHPTAAPQSGHRPQPPAGTPRSAARTPSQNRAGGGKRQPPTGPKPPACGHTAPRGTSRSGLSCARTRPQPRRAPPARNTQPPAPDERCCALRRAAPCADP